MIDMLVLRCPIKSERYYEHSAFGVPTVLNSRQYVNLRDLGIPLECSIDSDGEELSLSHRWEKIPSSNATMAFKLFDFRDRYQQHEDINDFYIEIKASPAKLMLGHNLFGSDDLWQCAEYMIHLLTDTYPPKSYPLPFNPEHRQS